MGDDGRGAAASQLARGPSSGIPGALDGADAEATASWDVNSLMFFAVFLLVFDGF